MFSGLTNKISNAYKDTYSKIVSPPTESKFAEKGILTPKEFILAGDQLVHMCPTWQWKPAVDEKHKRAELPDDKQYLYTRVPCQKRVRDVMELKTVEKDLGDGWSLAENESEIKDEANLVKKLDAANLLDENEKANKVEAYEEDEDGIKVKVTSNVEETKEEEDDFIAISHPVGSETRFYELTITYDFYYLTPRLWLSGYTEDNIPLSDKDMFEDIMDDYANKTVTYEAHPHMGVNQMSIHPCKHANVMKHLIDVAHDNGAKIEAHHAMFIFLKFISSVVPTMEYDFTVDVELSAAV